MLLCLLCLLRRIGAASAQSRPDVHTLLWIKVVVIGDCATTRQQHRNLHSDAISSDCV